MPSSCSCLQEMREGGVNFDWQALGHELSSLHGGMSNAAKLIEVPYQNFQRLCQGRAQEPKFSMGLKILAALGAISVDEKVLTVKDGRGTVLPTTTGETDHGPEKPHLETVHQD